MELMHFIFELQLGGIEELIKNLSLAMNQRGHHSTLVAFSQDSAVAVTEKYVDAFMANDIGYHCLHKPKGKQRFRTILRLRRLIRRSRPDVLIIHLERLTPLVLLAAWLLPVPIVQVIHNEYTRANRFHRSIARRFIKRYVAVSQNALEQIMTRFALRHDQAVLIRNGIKLTGFLQIPRDYTRMKRICHVGRLSEQKNQTGLIEIYRLLYERCKENQLKPPSLHLFGKGELEEQVRQKIEQAGLTDWIHLEGIRADMPAVYASCDLFILPSRWEGLPLVLLEAAGSGIPCICYAVGGVTEIITSGVNGFLVEAGNQTGMVDVLYRLVLDAKTRETTGCSARIAAERFDIRFCAQQYEALFAVLHK